MSKTDPEMEGRNRDPEREKQEKEGKRGTFPEVGEREGRTQTISRKKKKPLTFAAHKGRKNCH